MMENTTKYYVTASGTYLGGYEANPPEGAIEVPYAPDHAGQIWNGSGWGAIPLAVPASITRRQCARLLFRNKMITGPEMVAMSATGTPPAMVEVVFAAIENEDARNEARADFAADTYERGNPLLTGVMTDAITSQTPDATEAMINAAIDDFFRGAAVL
jgi:hypothetical protein